MKISIFGTGYVGLVTGICLAELGNEVVCVDTDLEKISLLKKGKSPIYERGMDELLAKNIAAKKISFTTDAASAIKHGKYLFIAVGTPSTANGAADLKYVFAVAKNIGKLINNSCLIIDKSTVPVGTGDKVKAIITQELKKRKVKIPFSVVSNPEFLKQGDAISDFMRSDRIIIGADEENALKKMYALYAPLKTPIISMSIRAAELTKYSANAFLAARISFMNELSALAEKFGVDIESVRQGIASDPRVGPYFLHAGCGYGGSCFPKDVKALIHMAKKANCEAKLITAIEEVNQKQKRVLFEKIKKHFHNKLKGKTFALWGLAFKPNTDDMREAPSHTILELLGQAGATVKVYDPIAIKTAIKIYGKKPKNIIFAKNSLDAAKNADALIIVTEWDEFRNTDLTKVKKLLKNKVIFDGRNLFQPKTMREKGFQYYGIGRK